MREDPSHEQWNDFDHLCCDNDVLDSFGPLSDDPHQVIYMYLRPR